MRDELNSEELALEAERAEAMYALAMKLIGNDASRLNACLETVQNTLNRLRKRARGKKATPAYQKRQGTLYRQIDEIKSAEIAKLKADLELVQGMLNRLRERAR
jgi:hypothetical protein